MLDYQASFISFISFVFLSTNMLIKLMVVICSFLLFFLFCRAYYWVIWVKLHTLWKTMPMLVKHFFLLFQVSVFNNILYSGLSLQFTGSSSNNILCPQVVHSGQPSSLQTLLH